MEENLRYAISILIFIVEGYLWHKLIYNICEFRFNKKYRLMPMLIWIMLSVINSIIVRLINTVDLSTISSIFSILIGFILSLFFYKDKITKSIIWNVVHLLLLAVSELSTIFFLWIGTGHPVEQVLNEASGFYIGVVISKLLMFFMVSMIIIKREQYNVFLKKGFFEIISLGVIILVIILYTINYLRNKEAFTDISDWFFNAMFASLFLIVVLVLRVVFQLFRVAQQELEAQHRVQKLEMELQFYSDMDKVVSSLRSLRHDLNNHFSIINGFLHAKEYQQCNTYMQEVCSELDIANSFVFVENTALSVLLNNKISKAKKMGIEIDNIISLDNFSMPYKTVCSLIGNILDNAIEATEKAEDKYIQLIVKGKDGECRISCENTYADKPIFSEGKYQTSKKDNKNHGIGLSAIRGVVKEYHGTIDIQVDDMFRITITLKA